VRNQKREIRDVVFLDLLLELIETPRMQNLVTAATKHGSGSQPNPLARKPRELVMQAMLLLNAINFMFLANLTTGISYILDLFSPNTNYLFTRQRMKWLDFE
jgi:hypothetical protein